MSYADRDFEPIEAHATHAAARASHGARGPITEVDAIYCMSLREQPHRTAAAVAHFRSTGLASQLILYRPSRGRHPPLEIWGGHRAMARHALACGHKRVLILEDDARLALSAGLLEGRLRRAISRLPAGWWGLYLGHFPVQAFPVWTNVLRTRSACTHAYVANAPLLEWLARAEPMDPLVRVCSLIGGSVDAAFANLPHMYALFPMVATVADMGDRRPDCVREKNHGLAALLDRLFWREILMFRCMRLSELAAVLLAPWHALTLEHFRRRSGSAAARAARLVLASVRFDAQAYLAAYPDVAAAGVNPFSHYLRHGMREGRQPAPSLSPEYAHGTSRKKAVQRSMPC